MYGEMMSHSFPQASFFPSSSFHIRVGDPSSRQHPPLLGLSRVYNDVGVNT